MAAEGCCYCGGFASSWSSSSLQISTWQKAKVKILPVDLCSSMVGTEDLPRCDAEMMLMQVVVDVVELLDEGVGAASKYL